MTVQSFLKKLRFLQIVLLAGYSLAISITLLLAYLDVLPLLPELKTNEYIDVVAIASGVAGVIAAFFLFQQLLLRVDENHSFSRKLSAFKTAFFLRLILIESVGMLSVVLFMISMNIIPIISAICIAVLLGLLKPSKNEMIKILQLSPGEQVKLNSSNTVLGDVHQQLFKHRMN
jgi:magnesium-transporting ATPase (P-type)